MIKKISIEGMSCEKCVAHVTEALKNLDKVSSVEVSLENKLAIVETENSNEEIKEAIEEEGYDVINIQ